MTTRCTGIIIRKEKLGLGLYRITRRRCTSEEALHGWCMLHYFKYTGQSQHHEKRIEPTIKQISPLFEPIDKDG